ncbi:MAG: glycosyltransferase, partial [Candidatus Norongarragalinales archaeon]
RVARALAKKLRNISYLRVPVKGRGLALRTAWTKSKADVLSYMDADLSTDLKHFPPLVQAVLDGADVAVGTRLARKSRTRRSLERELLSRAYNLLARAFLEVKTSDLQCGFKAISRNAARKLLPQVKDNQFFFDTELVARAERLGMKVAEVPVEWREEEKTRVNVPRTVADYLRDLARLRKELQ